MNNRPRRFHIGVGDAETATLKRRVQETRYPDQLNDDSWTYGMGKDYLKALADYWANEYDWRKHEARLNSVDEFMLTIDGLDIHFIHQRSAHENATPLLERLVRDISMRR